MTNVFRTVINVSFVLVIVVFALEASGRQSLARAEASSLIDFSAGGPPRVGLGRSLRLAQAASPARSTGRVGANSVHETGTGKASCALRAVPRRVAGPTAPGFGLSD